MGAQAQTKEGGLWLNTLGAAVGLIVEKGNVDIGTTNPKFPLTIFNENGGQLAVTGNSDADAAGILLFSDGTNNFEDGWIIQSAPVINALDFYSYDEGINLGVKMTILKGGNVGIGTANPGAKLEVNGGIKVGAATSCIDGTIHYTGGDFEGCKQGAWVSLTSGGEGGFCPEGQDYVAFGGTSICLADGAMASASCHQQYYSNESDPAINATVRARYINGQIQTTVHANDRSNGALSCDSGWVDGFNASCGAGGYDLGGSANTTSNGVSGSAYYNWNESLDDGMYEWRSIDCSTSVGAWQ